MQELRTEKETIPPPPGILASLRTGFDTVAGHISAILLPLAFDLLLWLGPHLSINQITQPVLKYFANLMVSQSGVTQGDINAQLDQYTQIFERFNLLGMLRTFPIGVFSLMTGKSPILSPLGSPLVLQVANAGEVVLLVLALTLAGWILGGVYFRWVAALVTPEALPRVDRAIVQTLIYSIIWTILMWAIGLPVLMIIYVLFAINQILGDVVLLIAGFMSMWAIVPIFFSAHGMFVKKQNALMSILSSIQMSRFTLQTSSLFVLIVILIGFGMNYLWTVPSEDSWLLLVGILGHAFITTALLAASFAYYRDMNAWLQTVLNRLRARFPTQVA